MSLLSRVNSFYATAKKVSLAVDPSQVAPEDRDLYNLPPEGSEDSAPAPTPSETAPAKPAPKTPADPLVAMKSLVSRYSTAGMAEKQKGAKVDPQTAKKYQQVLSYGEKLKMQLWSESQRLAKGQTDQFLNGEQVQQRHQEIGQALKSYHVMATNMAGSIADTDMDEASKETLKYLTQGAQVKSIEDLSKNKPASPAFKDQPFDNAMKQVSPTKPIYDEVTKGASLSPIEKKFIKQCVSKNLNVPPQHKSALLRVLSKLSK